MYVHLFCNSSINYFVLTFMIPFLLGSNLLLFISLTVFLAMAFADIKRIYFLIFPVYAVLYFVL